MNPKNESGRGFLLLVPGLHVSKRHTSPRKPSQRLPRRPVTALSISRVFADETTEGAADGACQMNEMVVTGPEIAGTYNYGLVAVSIFIAVMASYAALDLAGRVTYTHGRARHLWLIGGATAMGIGIWSMHYVGMLAFRLPMPLEYDWPTVLVSMVAAVLASAVALTIVSQSTLTQGRALPGSLLMGGGIAAMHYIG